MYDNNLVNELLKLKKSIRFSYANSILLQKLISDTFKPLPKKSMNFIRTVLFPDKK